MICYYQPHLNHYQPLRFEYEVRNIDRLERCLSTTPVAPAQFKHQVQAIYFKYRAPRPKPGAAEEESKAPASWEALRIEMKSKSDEFQVDDAGSRDGPSL